MLSFKENKTAVIAAASAALIAVAGIIVVITELNNLNDREDDVSELSAKLSELEWQVVMQTSEPSSGESGQGDDRFRLIYQLKTLRRHLVIKPRRRLLRPKRILQIRQSRPRQPLRSIRQSRPRRQRQQLKKLQLQRPPPTYGLVFSSIISTYSYTGTYPTIPSIPLE